MDSNECRNAVVERICSARANTDCGALGTLGVAAAVLTDGARAWSHAGILYRWKKEIRFFELRSHNELSDKPIKHHDVRPRIVWIEPRISRERALLIGGKCQLLLKLHQENNIPYGFLYGRTAFDADGVLRLGPGEVGLTCATIVDAIFASELMPLLEPGKWPLPDDNDKESRNKVIESIRATDRQHAEILKAEIGAPRIRPEEVVAAAAIHPIVGTFESLIEGAAVVTVKLGL